MLHQSELPKNLWAEAIHFAIWLKNRTSTRALGNTTPYERLYGQKPNLANVPEWGQQVWFTTLLALSYMHERYKLEARHKRGLTHWREDSRRKEGGVGR